MIRKNRISMVILALVTLLIVNIFLLSHYYSKFCNDAVPAVPLSLYFPNDPMPYFDQVEDYRDEELIFVLGHMSSGTTLLRTILDMHPEINCAREIFITMKTFTYLDQLNTSDLALEKATSYLIHHIMRTNFKTQNRSTLSKVKYLCNKEPQNTPFIEYIHHIFPRARFVYVVRDGRDMAYSFIKRGGDVNITFQEFYGTILSWNNANKRGVAGCRVIGPEQCMLFKYETLVNQPEPIIRSIAKFLHVDFIDDMLHYSELLDGKSDKIWLTMDREFVNKGVQRKPINNGSVGSWRNHIIGYDEEVIARNITMLKELNYI